MAGRTESGSGPRFGVAPPAPESGVRESGSPAAPETRTVLFVCHGPSCSERGSPETCRQLREAIAASAARRAVRVCETTCLDNCATGPNVVVGHEGQICSGVLAGAQVAQLVELLVSGVSAAGASGAPNGAASGASGASGAASGTKGRARA